MCHKKMQDVLIHAGSQGLNYVLNDDGKGYFITKIGTCADTDIIIPRAYNGLPVTNIGDRAFSGCSNLASIVIPDSVTTIGNAAFSGCSNLASIAISDSVTFIGECAFAGCSSLTSIIIPDSVTSIGLLAFDSCSSLVSIEVDNEYYKSIDGNLYTKDGKTLIQYAMGKQDTVFVIPDSVTSIGSAAFGDCSNLTSVVICDSITSIGTSVFNGCTGLAAIIIPNSVTFIGFRAFEDCTSLKDVYYIGSEEEWDEIEIHSYGNEHLINATIHYNYVPEN